MEWENVEILSCWLHTQDPPLLRTETTSINQAADQVDFVYPKLFLTKPTSVNKLHGEEKNIKTLFQ